MKLKSKKGEFLATAGALLQLPMAWLFVRMMSGGIVSSVELVETGFGFALPAGIIGSIIVILALVVKKYRAGWFFFHMLLYALYSLINLFTGTILGLFILVYLIIHFKEFFPPADVSSSGIIKWRGRP